MDQCDSVSSSEYHPAVRCQLGKNHNGPHFAQLGEISSAAWDAVTFSINFVEDSVTWGNHMTIVKSWVDEVAREINGLYGSGFKNDREMLKEIIEKHCPFKFDTAYQEVGDVQEERRAFLAKVQAMFVRIKMGRCWCSEGIGNPMMRGRHSQACLDVQKFMELKA